MYISIINRKNLSDFFVKISLFYTHWQLKHTFHNHSISVLNEQKILCITLPIIHWSDFSGDQDSR